MLATKQVGPFTVKMLTVEEGLDLVVLAGKDDSFNKELILRTVSKDGNPINASSFGDIVPHLTALINAAMELNGFRQASDDAVG